MFELPFVWGLPYAIGSTTQWNAADKKMADMMMSMFSTFARTGNPSLNTIKWEPHTEMNPGILIIERNIDMSDAGTVDFKALAFWNEYYPVLLEAATNNCCNVTSGAISMTTGFMGQFVPRSTGIIVTAVVTALKYFADQGFV